MQCIRSHKEMQTVKKNSSRLSMYKTSRGNILLDKFILNLPWIRNLNCYSDKCASGSLLL